MKQENFKYLYSFKYNNKEYIYLASKNYPFYFLEYNSSTKNFDHPDIETFKELHNKFYSNNELLEFNIIDEIKIVKSKLHNRVFTMTPLVKTTSGLVALAIALSLCGCTQTADRVETPTESTAIVETQDEDAKAIKEYFKEYNMDVTSRDYEGNDYIFVNEFINSKDKKQITLHTFEDFKEHCNITSNPSWKDVIESFKNNPNIDKDKLDIILDGIDNMKSCEELKDMDLSVLYANAQKMKFKYCTSEEMINTVGRDSVYAYFDVVSGTVYLPSDKPLEKFEFTHEVLGHGSLSYRDETKDTLTVFDCTNYIMLLTDNRYTGYSLGTVVSEGGANMIAHFATNDYETTTFYELYEEELRVIAELCNVSIGELFNHKGISLYDLMYKNGITTPVEYIFYMDGIFKGQLYVEFSTLMERLVIDATEEKLASLTPEEQQKLIASTIAIIRNSYFKDKKELRFAHSEGEITYNFEEAAESYETAVTQNKGKK